MLNKTILVFYVNVGNIGAKETSEYVNRLKESIKLPDEDANNVINYIIPVRGDSETRVECINMPTIITSEEQKYDILLRMEKLDNKLERISSQINADYERRKVIVEKS